MATDTPAVSRFSRGKRKRPYIPGDPDYELWLQLHPEWGYTYMPVEWLSALEERGKHGKTRALDAACEPHFFLHRRDYHFKSSVVSLADRGITRLINEQKISKRPRRPQSPYAHELGSCLAKAQVEIGVRKYPLVQFLPWRMLRTHPAMPADVVVSDDPFRFDLPEGRKHRFDGWPFVLQNNKDSIAFFDEYDRSTEDITGNARITIEKKLLDIQYIWTHKLYRRLFKRAMVRIITTVDYKRPEDPLFRQRKIMKLAEKLIGPCDYIIYQTVHDFERAMFSVKPSTELIDRPYLRVGQPGFSLTNLEDAPVGTPSFVQD